LPTALPLLGEEGVDVDGYPKQYVDRAALRSLLWHGRYAELTNHFEQIQTAFEKNPRYEYWPIDAGDAFASAEPSLKPKLDAWIVASPNSFAPYLARGSHYCSVGYASRGTKYASKTAESDFTTMEKAMLKALMDLETALRKRPSLNAAHRAKIQALVPTNRKKQLAMAIETAARACPECFQVRVTSIYTMTPRWGGSYEKMQAFAVSADVSKNPRFKLLPGYIALDRADITGRTDPAAARAEIEKACALGDHWEFLLARAESSSDTKDHAAATKDLDRALALRPKQIDCLIRRARSLIDLRKYEAAAVDYLDAVRIDPTDTRARRSHDTIVEGLVFQGWEAHKAKKTAEAVRLFDMAADLAPNNKEVQQRKVVVMMGGKRPQASDIAKYEAAVAAAPDDLLPRRQFDYAIAYTTRDFSRIVASWTDYISRHPDDGRAFVERSGAYHHLGKKSEAEADMRKACELGFSEGCGLMKEKK
jgi:tetratricopeptide (TPR) repeat protein